MKEKDVLDQLYEQRATQEEEYEVNFRNLVLKEQISILREYSDKNGLSADEIEKYKDILDSFLGRLFLALDDHDFSDDKRSIDINVWTHVNLLDGLMEGVDSVASKTYQKVDIEALCACARTYLENPWLSSGTLDWILLDSMMFYLLYSQMESFRKRTVKSTAVHALAKGMAVRSTIYMLVWNILSFGLRYLLPPFAIFKFYSNGQDGLGNFFVWAFGLYMLYKVICIPSYMIDRRQFKQAVAVWDDLAKIYHNMRTTTINLRTILSRLTNSKFESPLLDNYIVPILSRSVKTDAEVIFVWPEKLY